MVAYILDPSVSSDEDLIFQVCDSAIAVLTPDLLKEWLMEFKTIVENIQEIDVYATMTRAFDIEGQILVTVSDNGGELLVPDFEEFCEKRDIPCQPIIDSLDCTDVPVEDIYTGSYDDNVDLLTLLHKVYN
jgi:hypothetical protein